MLPFPRQCSPQKSVSKTVQCIPHSYCFQLAALEPKLIKLTMLKNHADCMLKNNISCTVPC